MSKITEDMIERWLGGEEDGSTLWRALETLQEIGNGEYDKQLFVDEVLEYNKEEID
jgi:hypothetical protein